MTKNLKSISYAKNIQSINLITNKERKGQSNFYPSVIENCGTTIYKQDIEMSENDIKKLPFDFSFKRQLSGGKTVIQS